MTKNLLHSAGRASLASGAALLALLTSCNKAPDPQVAAAAPAPAATTEPAVQAQPQTTVVVQDDYVYYPAYEVYYSSNRHDFRFREGNTWVTRSAPPRVAVDVLLASPSVRVDFHDAPEKHHENMMRTYPKNWAPPGRGRGEKDDRKEERKE